MKIMFIGTFLFLSLACFSQKQDTAALNAWKKIYRATPVKINDLVHTKLEVSFDYSRSWMYGKAWITLHPHFYPTDSLNLDAKNMNVNEVSMIVSGKHIPLKYTYDSLNLCITLDKTYRGGENYTVFIDYVSKPNDIKRRGSAAISSAKGLYFINPLGKDKNKPTQIWTQGETESNSSWFPTIDKPNQKTTDEISMTVPDKYLTLSNGLLVSKKKNNDGTRTDTWKMDLPHAPYLMMMAVGEFSVVKDKYKNKEVSYYVEKDYEQVARKIFGFTPEMIAFYSRITGVDFPWQKYAQIVCRDYVSGAMENTTATLHAESAQQDARQLIDGNSWEDVISHELFHMWFGDYVTTESWSNLTLNESFADFSEVLWEEYKHGKDAGDEHNFVNQQNYIYSRSEKLNLVRFYYNDREDMFDLVSYQKGGRILNMLRNYVGDSAFFKSLNLYLRTKKFNSAEAQDLRLAFEEVTGQDLNWYWNQWYYGSGHPKLEINYDYDNSKKIARVFVKQTQQGKIFRLPVAIDVYQGGNKQRHKIWIEHQADTFSFKTTSRPDLINFDGDKIILCEKTDNKNLENFIFQYKNAGLYLDRREAIDFVARKQNDDPRALDLMKTALKDNYPGLRTYAMQRLSMRTDSLKRIFEPILLDIARNDPKSTVRAAAIQALGRFKNLKYQELFLKSVNDSSYTVSGNSLIALGSIDSVSALAIARRFSGQKVKEPLSTAINNLLYTYASEGDFEFLSSKFDQLPIGNAKYNTLQPFANYLKKLKNEDNFKKGIDMIVSFRDSVPKQIRQQVESYFNGMILNGIASAKQSQGLTSQAEYVKSKINIKKDVPAGVEVPVEILKKYSGNYDYNEANVEVVLKDNKTLNLRFPGSNEMELMALSKTKFSIKYMEGYTIEFTFNDKNEVSGCIVASPSEEMKLTRKN